MENMNIEIQIPTEQLKELIENLIDEFINNSIDDYADQIKDKIEDSLTEEVCDYVRRDLVSNIDDYICIQDIKDQVNESIDIYELAKEVRDELDIPDVTDEIENLADQFNPGKHCRVGKAVEKVIEDGVVYSLTHNDEFARAMGSFIDNWLYQPNPDPQAQKAIVDDAINRILGREDASNIHNDLVANPTTLAYSDETIELTRNEINNLIYNSISQALNNKELSVTEMKFLILENTNAKINNFVRGIK